MPKTIVTDLAPLAAAERPWWPAVKRGLACDSGEK